MTIAPDKPNATELVVPEGHVKLVIDGVEVVAPKGELLIRTAERLGTVIPRFCDHPLLEPAGACRQCLVEVEMGGRPMPKPQASCTMTVADGMVVKTQLTSPVADKAQQGVMELLLINHPLDCPICDKGGECPLQNQAIAHGRSDSRFHEHKRTFPKPISISTQVLLDRERCVLCQRCTRFSAQIAGDPFIELLERGALQQIGTAPEKPFQSYFSGNTIQICPVGALTSAAYRFRARPFDLVSTPSICEHCSSGCAERTDWRRGKVQRKLAGDDPQVNEEWICDKGRFAFRYATADDRITRPMVRDAETGELRESSWTEALQVAAAGLAAARDANGVGVLTGGRLTVEDAYAYSKFARIALRTNDIDFRARPHSAEELEFLSGTTVFTNPDNGVTFQGIESAPAALLVAFEPEEEAPIVFLRLRKAARRGTTKVFHLGQFTTPAVEKTFGTLLACVPGAEANALNALPDHASDVVELLSKPGAVILVGERAAEIPGAFTAVAKLAERTGARVAWIPRRAGERGALAVGAVPNLLPGGRHVTSAAARTEVERTWGVGEGSLPATPGRDTTGILTAAANGELSGLVVGGVDPFDLPDPVLAEAALVAAGFVVSLELRPSAVTAHADVVLPIAPAVEKSGTYLNWEGRRREFGTTLEGTGALSDCRVLDTLAVEMDADLFTQTPAAAAADLARLGEGASSGSSLNVAAPLQSPAGPGKAVLATWHRLIGNGSLQVDEPHLAGTARPVVAKVAETTAQQFGLTPGGHVTVSTDRGAITLPVETDDLPEGVIWLPTNSGDVTVRATLGAGHGSIVSVSGGPSFGVKS
ncbi:NADH-quinone oxidoreductase subunit G [Nocardia sp. NRRL S-836]|uniref:NADH-quinone oxidoreductase subunit G n=1 Tax=Nocardia sp. NRRL S-836 TaxID=1519492 RepID=UPI0006AF59F4|nr:NADH-quinone oxidoreductase subunit G [Nocardia sp. NRRL S-836]KOV85735.1 NADH-quinone oxidoreductase subunit G [Nocardia sp. NRRL S-836]